MTLSVLANIDVDDLAHAAEFYCAALELEVGRRFGDQAIELVGASSKIYLLKHAAGTLATPSSSQRRDFTRHWTPVHLDFHVADFDAAVERVRAAGGAIENEFRHHGPKPVAFCGDPFGNGFCVIGD